MKLRTLIKCVLHCWVIVEVYPQLAGTGSELEISNTQRNLGGVGNSNDDYDNQLNMARSIVQTNKNLCKTFVGQRGEEKDVDGVLMRVIKLMTDNLDEVDLPHPLGSAITQIIQEARKSSAGSGIAGRSFVQVSDQSYANNSMSNGHDKMMTEQARAVIETVGINDDGSSSRSKSTSASAKSSSSYSSDGDGIAPEVAESLAAGPSLQVTRPPRTWPYKGGKPSAANKGLNEGNSGSIIISETSSSSSSSSIASAASKKKISTTIISGSLKSSQTSLSQGSSDSNSAASSSLSSMQMTQFLEPTSEEIFGDLLKKPATTATRKPAKTKRKPTTTTTTPKPTTTTTTTPKPTTTTTTTTPKPTTTTTTTTPKPTTTTTTTTPKPTTTTTTTTPKPTTTTTTTTPKPTTTTTTTTPKPTTTTAKPKQTTTTIKPTTTTPKPVPKFTDPRIIPGDGGVKFLISTTVDDSGTLSFHITVNSTTTNSNPFYTEKVSYDIQEKQKKPKLSYYYILILQKELTKEDQDEINSITYLESLMNLFYQGVNGNTAAYDFDTIATIVWKQVENRYEIHQVIFRPIKDVKGLCGDTYDYINYRKNVKNFDGNETTTSFVQYDSTAYHSLFDPWSRFTFTTWYESYQETLKGIPTSSGTKAIYRIEETDWETLEGIVQFIKVTWQLTKVIDSYTTIAILYPKEGGDPRVTIREFHYGTTFTPYNTFVYKIIQKSQSTNRTTIYSTNQSTDQSTYQSSNQSTDQSSHQSANQSRDQSTNQSTNHSTNQSRDQSTNQSTNQSGDQSTNQSTNQSRDQSTNQSRDQSTNQSTNQSGDQSTNQSGDQSTNQSTNKSKSKARIDLTNQSTDQSNNQPTDQSNNQSTNQSRNQNTHPSNTHNHMEFQELKPIETTEVKPEKSSSQETLENTFNSDKWYMNFNFTIVTGSYRVKYAVGRSVQPIQLRDKIMI